MLLGWLRVLLVTITAGTVEQLFQKRGGIPTSGGFIDCRMVRKLRSKLCYTPRVSLPLQCLDMQENCVFLATWA